jgi:uncharacterized membrane protein
VKIKHPVLRGHPLHAMASDLPIALIPLALVASLVAGRSTSRAATRLAAGSALAAVLLGWWDWLTIPRSHPAWRPATLHGLINTSVLGGTALAVLARDRRPLLLGAATAALTVSAWIGGDLVYRLGWRVRPAEELELITEEAEGALLAPYQAQARRKIEEHERSDTILPGS